jgi:hypothetical protein
MVDALELRGVPMIGRGVAGAQPGSNPVGALLAKERRARRRGVVLSDEMASINVTAPGSRGRVVRGLAAGGTSTPSRLPVPGSHCFPTVAAVQPPLQGSRAASAWSTPG